MLVSPCRLVMVLRMPPALLGETTYFTRLVCFLPPLAGGGVLFGGGCAPLPVFVCS